MERNPNLRHRQLLSTWAPTAAKCDAHCPVFPDCRHVGVIRYPSVHSRCHSEFAWLLSESHVRRPRWELLTVPSTSTAGRFAFGLDRVFARPPNPLPQMAYVRQTKKETDFDQKKKKKKNWKRIQQQLGEPGREPASISGLLCADTSLPGLWPLVFRPPSQLL